MEGKCVEQNVDLLTLTELRGGEGNAIVKRLTNEDLKETCVATFPELAGILSSATFMPI